MPPNLRIRPGVTKGVDMSDIEAALESWDGQSEPPQEIVEYMKNLPAGEKPSNEKVANYLGAGEANRPQSA
jgi:hypothetical protein